MKKITFGMVSLVVGVAQIINLFTGPLIFKSNSKIPSTTFLSLLIGMVVLGGALAIVSLIFERDNKTAVKTAILGLVFSISPIIIALYYIVF